MHRILLISILIYLVSCNKKTDNVFAQAPPTKTPPMGWNSYNAYNCDVKEDEVMENAMLLAAGLKQYGWQYIVIDGGWYTALDSIRIDSINIPNANIDMWGRFLPDTIKYRSSTGNIGMKQLADRIHALGLKFGIHLMRGIPKQAVLMKTPIKGATGITANMIADKTSLCSWNTYMYGLKMNVPGAQEYVNSLFELYASWGVDFVKIDDMSYPYHKQEIEAYNKAVQQCGRYMVISLSPGESPLAEKEHLVNYADMWRVSGDFPDSWWHLREMFRHAKNWQNIRNYGKWPDLDMLQLGKIKIRHYPEPARYSRFTEDEACTHFTLWAIFRSPLMIGCQLADNREIDRKLMTNEEVIAVNQKGFEPRIVYEWNGTVVWMSKNIDGSRNVALFNLTDAAKKMEVVFKDIELASHCTIRNIWEKKDLGPYDDSFSFDINPHGCMLLNVKQEDK